MYRRDCARSWGISARSPCLVRLAPVAHVTAVSLLIHRLSSFRHPRCRRRFPRPRPAPGTRQRCHARAHYHRRKSVPDFPVGMVPLRRQGAGEGGVLLGIAALCATTHIIIDVPRVGRGRSVHPELCEHVFVAIHSEEHVPPVALAVTDVAWMASECQGAAPGRGTMLAAPRHRRSGRQAAGS